MKIQSMILALAALQSTAFAAEVSGPVKMEDGCENMIRSAVASLESGYMMPDENTGAVTLAKEDLASVKISNVKILHSSCQGPGDCDAQNPDSFTYGADIGKKGEGLTGKVVVSYHRGNCFVSKISLSN
ncbi:MAG: hypothetical protein ACXVB9_12205 [Bdellovibrionota bacterium]